LNDKKILKEMKEARKRNFEDRLKFIDFYVDNLKKNPKKCFKEQKDFINSLL
jgi:hypothetical protein